MCCFNWNVSVLLFTHHFLFPIQSAEKQGNQLHMNVYKMKGQACGGPLKTEVKELKGDLRPAPPYPSRVKTVDKGTQVTPEREAVRTQTQPVFFLHTLTCITLDSGSRTTSCCISRPHSHISDIKFSTSLMQIWCIVMQVTVKDTKGNKPEDEPPPMWFRSYMEKVMGVFFSVFLFSLI